MKKTLLAIIALLTIAAFSYPCAAQDAPKAESRTPKKDFIYGKDDLAERFYATARKILRKQNELGLSNEQMRQIRQTFAETKIKVIEKNKDIETVTVSSNAFIWENPFEIDKITNLAAEKHNLIMERDKLVIDAFQKLGGFLTDAQKEKLRKQK